MKIADRYEINEPLKEKDLAFVEQYADKPQPKPQPDEFVTMGYNQGYVSGSSENTKIRTNINGFVWSDIGIINNSFGGNVSVNVTKGTPTSIKVLVRHVAFGALGSGGTIVGKVQDKTLSSTCTGGVKSCNLNRSHQYVASVAYATTYADGLVTYSGGSISVSGN
jgi:hypothetical protein